MRLSLPPTLEEIKEKNPLVTPGGHYHPPDCEPRHHTAIVIPYRNRMSHLRTLLYHLHPFLQRQQIQYGIYIVHQVSCNYIHDANLAKFGTFYNLTVSWQYLSLCSVRKRHVQPCEVTECGSEGGSEGEGLGLHLPPRCRPASRKWPQHLHMPPALPYPPLCCHGQIQIQVVFSVCIFFWLSLPCVIIKCVVNISLVCRSLICYIWPRC